MNRLRIIEISLPHFTAAGTVIAAGEAMHDVARSGFNTILLLPVMPISPRHSRSPYAITSYSGVDSQLGTEAHLRQWLTLCHEFNIEVILDLPINHTSPYHEWSCNLGWYSLDSQGMRHAPIGTSWHDVVQLNHNHTSVIGELKKTLAYWLSIGFDGFRYDAARYIQNDLLKELIESANLSADRRIHHWCDDEALFTKAVGFTEFLDHEGFRLLSGTGKSDKLPERPSNAILYTSNHDTMQSGMVPSRLWGNNYRTLLDKLIDAPMHLMQSHNEWRNPSTCFSFLR